MYGVYKMNFKAIAKKQTTMAEIMIDREKITTQEIIDDFDGEITIDNIEFCHIGSDDVWAYTFEEDETKFAFAGYILSKIFNACLEAVGGDFEELYKQWTPLKVKLSEGKTKNKNQVTLVEVLD